MYFLPTFVLMTINSCLATGSAGGYGGGGCAPKCPDNSKVTVYGGDPVPLGPQPTQPLYVASPMTKQGDQATANLSSPVIPLKTDKAVALVPTSCKSRKGNPIKELCEKRNEVNHLLESQKYMVYYIGNRVMISKNGKVMLMIVITKVPVQTPKKKQQVIKATAVVRFDALGRVVYKKGTIPQRSDPCNACREQALHGVISVNGKLIKCNCDSGSRGREGNLDIASSLLGGD